MEPDMKIEYMDATTATFSRTDGGLLSLRIGRRKPFPRVHLYRVFPLSEPSRLISVRDDKDAEIGIIESLGDFSPDTRRLLKEELDRRYFTPSIHKLVSLKEEFGYTYWDAETDAGFSRFTVKGGDSNVFQVTEGTLLIIDVDGNRFEYPDFESTEPKFMKLIDTML